MMGRAPEIQTQQGISLVEVVISIVVLAAALGGIYGALANLSVSSVDPMLQKQGLAIAEAYMEEVLSKQMADGACPAVPGGGGRADYSYVCHHAGTDNGARNQNGNSIAGLEQYNVTVSVNDVALNGIAAGQAKQIRVAVTHDSANINVQLTGYRTLY